MKKYRSVDLYQYANRHSEQQAAIMTNQEKAALMKLVHSGNIQETINVLSTTKRSESLDREAFTIAARYSQLKRKERSGILTFEQLNIAENQIVDHLINIINHPEDVPYSIEQSIDKTPATQPVLWKYSIVAVFAIIVLFSLAELFNVINVFTPDPDNDLKLTVFVTDTQGNAVPEHTGKLNVTVGGRSFTRVIGENGSASFPDIASEGKKDTIWVDLEAEGWAIDGKNAFIFTGEPVILKVRRKNNLDVIKGMDKSKNEQEPVGGGRDAH